MEFSQILSHGTNPDNQDGPDVGRHGPRRHAVSVAVDVDVDVDVAVAVAGGGMEEPSFIGLVASCLGVGCRRGCIPRRVRQ